MDKDKIEIVRGYVEREIEYAKTIANPNTSRGDKIWAYHCRGANNMGVIFQLNKLKREQQSQGVNIDKAASQTITIDVPKFDDDLCDKIRGAISKQEIIV